MSQPSKPVVIKISNQKAPVPWGEQLAKPSGKKSSQQASSKDSASLNSAASQGVVPTKKFSYQLSCDTRASSHIDEELIESFPSLTVKETQTENTQSVQQPFISEDFAEDSFVLGSESLSSHTNSESQNTSDATQSSEKFGHQKKRPKKQVLFHVTL